MFDRTVPTPPDGVPRWTPQERLENAWRAWCPGAEAPCWHQLLTTDGVILEPEAVLHLIKIDLEQRAKAGLPGLLQERHLHHPRLASHGVICLSEEAQLEVIRWDYQRRWHSGQRPRRADYQAAFSQHADALADLRPRCRCPVCRRVVMLEETEGPPPCPHCGTIVLSPEPLPAADRDSISSLDLRGYELAECLGQGGMGAVYRAADPALGRDLAVKVIRTELQGNGEAERRFRREALITGLLQHPGIVPVHNLGRLADGRLHYTMRLVRGQTFAELLAGEAGQPERLPALLSIFEKICQAVAYAHSECVIHRDLKPTNIMVGRFGEVQVMDWGLAKVLTAPGTTAPSEETAHAPRMCLPVELSELPVDLTRPGSGLGTPAYMPPEQARGESDAVDERADVFALGSILCEMLTGQPAYRGADGNEVFRRAQQGDATEALERLRQCGADPALTALCRECLQPDRAGRPRSAEDVAQRLAVYQAEVQQQRRRAELERVAAEARAHAEHERAREALARAEAERRAKWRTLALAAAVVLLLAGGAGVYWWRQLEQDRIIRAEQLAASRRDALLDADTAMSLEARKAAEDPESVSAAAGLHGARINILNAAYYGDDRQDDEIRKKLAWACNDLAFVRLLQKKPQGALIKAHRAVETAPEIDQLKVNLAHAFLFNGDLENALDTYRRCRPFAAEVGSDFDKLRRRGLCSREIADVMKRIEEELSPRAQRLQ